MQLIPVLDLCQGQVVQAWRGQRQRYRPLSSCLSADSDPFAVLTALLALWPFTRVYIADLDAITASGDNGRLIRQLLRAFPGLHFWVDAGIDASGQYPAQATLPGVRPVLGTEQRASAEPCLPLLLRYPESILSLDLWRAGQEIPWLAARAHWPRDLIVMSLHQVGSMQGPDYPALEAVRHQAPAGSRIHLAGGVRDLADIQALARRGVAGVLLSSALHQGVIDQAALAHCPAAGGRDQ